jgi:hypothetical protein
MTLILLDNAVALFSSKTWWPGSARARVARVKLTDPFVHLYYHDAPSVGSPLSKSSYRLTSRALSCNSAKTLVAARRLAPAAGRSRSARRCAVTSRCFSLSLNFTSAWWFDAPEWSRSRPLMVEAAEACNAVLISAQLPAASVCPSTVSPQRAQ